MSNSTKTLFHEGKEQDCYAVVDGNFYLHRAKFAYKNFTNKKGQHTGILYGFFSMLFKEFREVLPEIKRVYIVFDGEFGTQYRKKIYKGYKAKREKQDDVFPWSMGYIAKLCNTLKWVVIQEPDQEGDDVINALVNMLKVKGFVYVMTEDKDMMACIEENVTIYNPVKRMMVDRKEVVKRLNIPPKQVRLYLSLMGDKGDGIPGVAGFGKKTAETLCKKYKTRKLLLASKELNKKQRKEFILSYKLVKPMIKKIKVPKYERVITNEEAYRILKYFEVKTLVNEFHNRGVRKP